MGIGDDLTNLGDDLAGLAGGDPDALQDIKDLADSLGVPFVGDVLDGISKALAENGLPPIRYRFLYGEPKAPKTTADKDARDWITQGVHALDNVAGLGGKAELLGAAGEHLLGMNKDRRYDHPEWAVYRLHCTEGLSQLYRCELILVRHETGALETTAGRNDLWSAVDNALSSHKTAAGNEDLIADGMAVWNAGQQAVNDWNNPRGALKDVADVEDPDAIIPEDQKNFPTPVDPASFVGGDVLCRVSLARRMDDGLTLSERWFTGIANEFEDRGYFSQGGAQYHVIRVVIVPQLWRLSLRRNCRVFQDKTAVEIIQTVLKEHAAYNTDGRWELELKPPGKSLVGGLHVPDALANVVPGGLLAEDAGSWGPKRELCVQYNETDLDFVLRLMEEEGISYHFEHYERKSVLVLSDDPKLAGSQTRTIDRQPLPVIQADPAGAMVETAAALGVNRRLIPNKVTLRDFIYTYPNRITELLGGHQTPSLTGGTNILTRAVEAVQSTLLDDHKDYGDPDARVFEYPGYFVLLPDDDAGPDGGAYRHYQDPNLAEFRMDVIRAAEAVGEGESNVFALTPAHHVDVLGGFDIHQPDTIDPQKFLVTVVEHKALPGTNAGYDQPAPVYRNRFQCVNASKVRFRPARRTPRPAITGVQTATVLDPKSRSLLDASNLGDEVTCDAFGRVYVRLHWDRRPRPGLVQAAGRAPGSTDDDPARTCWVRVAQNYAGGQFGTVFVPRVGMEVVLHFLEGNPDRPVVVGCVYNGFENPNKHLYFEPDESKRAVPVNTEGQQVRSILKTRTVPRTENGPYGWNAIRLDDHGGFEEVLVRAERDLTKLVKGDHVTSVRANQRNIVGGEEPKQTAEKPNAEGTGNQTETVHGDAALLVTEEAPDDAAVTREKTLLANEKVFVGEDPSTHKRDEEVAGNELIEVLKTRKERVKWNETVTVNGKPEIPPFGPPHPVAAAAGSATEQTSNPEAANAANPAAAQTYARTLTVYGSNHVWVTRNDTNEVRKGDRLTDVKGALVVNAQSITMVPLGDDGQPVGGDQSGAAVDDEGVKLNAKKSAHVEARNVLFQSKNDGIVVSAKQIIQLRAGYQSVITLNANTGTIHVHADKDGGIRFGAGKKFISITENRIAWNADDSTYTTQLEAGQFKSEARVKGSVEVKADGEVHFNAQSVKVEPTLNGVVDGDRGLPSTQDPNPVETPKLKGPGEQGVDPNAPTPAKVPDQPAPGADASAAPGASSGSPDEGSAPAPSP